MKIQNNSRRSFLKKATFGTLAAIGIPEIVIASMGKGEIKKVTLSKGQTILIKEFMIGQLQGLPVLTGQATEFIPHSQERSSWPKPGLK
jgi:hypothetical protein